MCEGWRLVPVVAAAEIRATFNRSEKCGKKKAKEWDSHLEEGTVVREAQGGRQHVESYVAGKFLLILNPPQKL